MEKEELETNDSCVIGLCALLILASLCTNSFRIEGDDENV